MKVSSKTVVEVVPYNPNWPLEFDQEAKKIGHALGEICVEIHHVGSTSVPGLAAKPRIDIIAVLSDTSNAIEKLEGIGYKYKGEFNIPFHLGFTKRTTPQVNLHVYEVGNPEIELNLLFRDYLRTHPKDRDVYQSLKFKLVKEKSAHVKTNSLFRGYTLGKDEFIKRILETTGFQRICLRFACHHQEWETIKELRQKYFYDQLGIKDPYDWTAENKKDIHFILYKGIKIIGYSHVELLQGNKAKQGIFIIENEYLSKEIENEFMERCALWFKKQGINMVNNNG